MDSNFSPIGTLVGYEFAKAPNGDIYSRVPKGQWRFYSAAGVFPLTIAGQYFAGNDTPLKALDGLIAGIAPAHLRK